MRFLVFTDLQAGEGSERCFHDPTLPLQRYRVDLFFETMARLFADCGCDAVIDCGDLLDDRTAVPVPTLNSVFKGLLSFMPGEAVNYKLLGNHELYLRTNGIHSGPAFSSFFRVFSEPEVVDIEGVRTLFCPFPSESFDLEAWLSHNLLQDGRPQVVFGHFQVEGTSDRDGRCITGGVKLSCLKHASLVLLGHIHHPQSITDTIHYIGSPFQQDFGEAGEQKRVLLLDYPSLAMEWIHMDGFPTYETLGFKEWETREVEANENRYRVVLGSREEHELYLKNPAMPRTTAVYQASEQLTKPKEASSSAKVSSFCLRDVLTRYFKLRPPKELHGMTPEEYVQVGLDLTKEC